MSFTLAVRGKKSAGLIFAQAAAATLLVRLKKKGQEMPVKDSLIAVSASQHQLTIVTRNIDDFRNVGVPLLNPFGSQ